MVKPTSISTTFNHLLFNKKITFFSILFYSQIPQRKKFHPTLSLPSSKSKRKRKKFKPK